MGKYESQEAKINSFLESVIIPALEVNDLDYNKVVKNVAFEKGVKEDKVKQSLQILIEMGKIKEIHILTIPDEKFEGMLKNMATTRKEVEKEIKEVGLK